MLRGDTDNNGAKNALRCDGSRSALHRPSHRAASGIAPHCIGEVKGVPSGSEECKVKSEKGWRGDVWCIATPAPAQFLIQNSQFIITSQFGSCPKALRQRKQKTAVPDMRHRSLIFPDLSSAQRASPILNSKFSIQNYLAAQFLIQNSTFLIIPQLGSCPKALRLTKQKTAVPDMRHRSLIFPELSSAQRASLILNSKFPILNYPVAWFLTDSVAADKTKDCGARHETPQSYFPRTQLRTTRQPNS